MSRMKKVAAAIILWTINFDKMFLCPQITSLQTIYIHALFVEVKLSSSFNLCLEYILIIDSSKNRV